jgi:chemotaxis protein methyltransferase CheR
MSTAIPASIDATAFDYIRRLVLERSAIVLDENKTYLVESRLAPIVREHGLESIDQLASELRSRSWSVLHQLVVEALTTNETSFFRDLHPFETLRKFVLPELIQRRAMKRTINIWSAACSTGQEPYTIAITLREHFPELNTWAVRIYGSDLSQQVLKRAHEGIYHQNEMNRGMPATLLVKYFQKRGLQWAIREDIRRSVEFMEVNLAERWPSLPTMDIVFLRNVLIYFSCETKRKILNAVRRILATDGCLFLGGAETTLNLDDNFCRVQTGNSVHYVISSPETKATHLGVPRQ